jgi:hypothetical protein
MAPMYFIIPAHDYPGLLGMAVRPVLVARNELSHCESERKPRCRDLPRSADQELSLRAASLLSAAHMTDPLPGTVAASLPALSQPSLLG